MSMLSGVILAGGNHRDLQERHPSFVTIDGETILERQIREMKSCCSDITVVTNHPELFLRAVDRDIRIITDYYSGRGYLSGMHAGLSLAKRQDVWVLGCHMPYASADAARFLESCKQEGMHAVIPWLDHRAQPLHGIYDRSSAEWIEKMLCVGGSDVGELLRKLNWREVAEGEFAGQGIDTRFIRKLRAGTLPFDERAELQRRPV
ncbi:molybdenum cofactor guanylyltransferase [Paenibacillus soyae]|uniref:Molybdenum cofactor guanylyltransferase n=1 Tax=Paenibacillus soyae TaxID=2969249 RepID=A0A9X2S871_9BACL|nr:molybdenum cofactor guanylyltransferase [Paenibacillus soyae]MCR2804049.1 molybdenum cofactor guanylyltransferase [Paenibacillus soyae]